MKYVTLLFLTLSALFTFSQAQIEKVYFDVDEFILTTEAKKVLDEILPAIQNKNLEITGYTDSTGSVAYNLALSKKRAQSVSDYLVSKGINSKNMKPLLSEGETTSAPSLDQNRRVSIGVFNVNVIPPDTKEEHISKTQDGELNQETMDNVVVGDILNIGGLEFHGGRHLLKSYSLPILDKLTNVLLDNPDVKIEIQGHICCQPGGDGLDTDTGTRNLSENRAEVIYLELIKRGISKDRLTYKGYGAFRKLEEEINPEAMQRNRRVSILIIEK
jgi:outer membrane protein OmpA-like peptidoglycan-associated protein